MPTLCTEAFTACGGDPAGMWTSGLLDGDLAASINSTRSAACNDPDDRSRREGDRLPQVHGCGARHPRRHNATVTTRSTESISPACATEAFQVTTLDAAACTQIQTTIKNSDPELMTIAETTVSYSLIGANCDCRITIADVQMAQNFVTVTGSNIAESDSTTSASAAPR